MCLITVIYIIKYKKIRYSWPIDREQFYLKFVCTPFDKLVNVDIFYILVRIFYSTMVKIYTRTFSL